MSHQHHQQQLNLEHIRKTERSLGEGNHPVYLGFHELTGELFAIKELALPIPPPPPQHHHHQHHHHEEGETSEHNQEEEKKVAEEIQKITNEVEILKQISAAASSPSSTSNNKYIVKYYGSRLSTCISLSGGMDSVRSTLSISSTPSPQDNCRLHHLHDPNQPKCVDLIMEYVAGGSLADLIRSTKRPLSELLCRKYTAQILTALDFLQRKAQIHSRDIKSHNILLDSKGGVRLCDFGEGKARQFFASTSSSSAHSESTSTTSASTSTTTKSNHNNSNNNKSLLLSSQIGTAHFAAPEVFSGQKYSGSAAEVWSVGIVLFEMLTGSLPSFGLDENANAYAVMFALSNGEFEMPNFDEFYEKNNNNSKISEICEDFVLNKCLVKDPAKRATVRELLQHEWILRGNSNASSSSSFASPLKNNSSTSTSSSQAGKSEGKSSGYDGDRSQRNSTGSSNNQQHVICTSSGTASYDESGIVLPTGEFVDLSF